MGKVTPSQSSVWLLEDTREIGWVVWDSGCPVTKDAATACGGPGPLRAECYVRTGGHLMSGRHGHEGGTTQGQGVARK